MTDLVRGRAAAAAGADRVLTKQETAHDPLLRAAAEAARKKHGRATVDSTVEVVMARANSALEQVNQPRSRAGWGVISKRELDAASALEPALADVFNEAWASASGIAPPEPPRSRGVRRTDSFPLPSSWVPDLKVTGGTVRKSGGRLELEGFDQVPPGQRPLVERALTDLWGLVLSDRADRGSAPLGGRRVNGNGELHLGSFKDRRSGQEYLVAAWRDIDDSSYTLYYQPGKTPGAPLQLRIEQFDN